MMTDEEDNLFFEEAMLGVKKMEYPTHIIENSKKRTAVKKKDRFETPLTKIFTHNVELDTTSDIDKQTLKRFKREEFGVEAELDLHGFTTDKAFEAVRRFVISSFNQSKRAILIVTGKGLPHHDQDIFDVKGVLKQQVPIWLKDDELAPMILTFIHPSAKLGGTGALYILLRRKRS